MYLYPMLRQQSDPCSLAKSFAPVCARVHDLVCSKRRAPAHLHPKIFGQRKLLITDSCKRGYELWLLAVQLGPMRTATNIN